MDTTFESCDNEKSPSKTPANTLGIVTEALEKLKTAQQPTIHAAIYCPDNDYEILLAESAQTLAVRCLFGMMGNINVVLKFAQNVSDMTPGGYVPLVRVSSPSYPSGGTDQDYSSSSQSNPTQNAILVNFESISSFCQARYEVLSENMNENLNHKDNYQLQSLADSVIVKNIQFFHVDSHEFSEMNLFMNLCTDFSLVELYINWIHEPTFLKITSKRFTFRKPWPLDTILLNQKRNSVRNLLKAKGWNTKGLKAVETIYDQLLSSFSYLLGHKKYLLSTDRPCVLDAVLFGHLYTLMTTRGIDNRFADAIQKYSNLVSYLKNMEEFAVVAGKD